MSFGLALYIAAVLTFFPMWVVAETGPVGAKQGHLLTEKKIARAEETSVSRTVSGKRRKSDLRPDSMSEQKAVDEFRVLDQETEQLLKQVLDLGSDLAILEEEQNNPAKFQLLVLVTMDPTNLFKLDYIELKIDNQTVAAYNYTSTDVRALLLGGGHRLYLANLPAGMHKLSATMAGRIPRDPDYKKSINYNFISGVSRTVLELSVSGVQNNGFPSLLMKEWN